MSLFRQMREESVDRTNDIHTIPYNLSLSRLMREESVDGTLSPVSMKGGIELLDNDTGTARRKVTGFYVQIFPSWCCGSEFCL